ncbi:MAG: NADPH-dependent FMN reductase [Patescibacteria group bacterium]
MSPKILTILGSTRQGRIGDQVAAWITKLAEARTDLSHELADLRAINLPMFDEATNPSSGNYTNPQQQAWAKTVGAADGFIIVTPEYNHGYPAALKNALDFLYAEWNTKPVGFVSYGGLSGGIRAVEQLRQVAVELQMVPIEKSVNLPFMKKILDTPGQLEATYDARLTGFLDQLVWWANVCRAGQAQYPLPK